MDKLGIWPYDRDTATAFFTLASARYERDIIIIPIVFAKRKRNPEHESVFPAPGERVGE